MLRALSIMTVVLTGCYDWQVGASPLDAGRDAHPMVDVGIIQADTAPPPKDAGHPVDAFHGSDAGRDSPGSTASCPMLLAMVNEAEVRAISCTQGSTPVQCAMSVQDPCGCSLFVANPASTATTDYTSAVDALKAAACTASCSNGCAVATGGACVLEDIDGSVMARCAP